MSGKEVCKWLLSKLDDQGLYDLFKSSKATWKGFRVNSVNDVKSKRGMFINNLVNQNTQKVLIWFKISGPYGSLEELELEEKELNELEVIANQEGAVPVFCQLLHLELVDTAVRLYALLKDNDDNLLKIPDKTFGAGFIIDKETNAINQSTNHSNDGGDTKEQNDGNKSEETVSKENKKIDKLLRKIENLENELKKRDEQYKKKLETIKNNHQEAYSDLHGKFDKVSKEYKELLVKSEETEKQLKNSEAKKQQLSQDNLRLQIELKKAKANLSTSTSLSAKQEAFSNHTDNYKIPILVIGEVASEKMFKSDTFDFTFIGTENLEDFTIEESYQNVWIMSYGMTARDQYYLNKNESFTLFPHERIKQFNHFSEVQLILNKSKTHKVRII